VSVSYNTAAISKLLNSALSDQALTLFCYNYYPTVHEKFTSEIAHLWKTQLLVDYCKRHNQLDQLLAHIAKIDPDQYKEFIETLAEPVHGSEEDIGTDRSRIEIVFDGDSADFTLELQLAAISAMAEVLEIPSDQINILLVETGSIVLQVEMPTAATSRLMSLCKANDSVIHALGIQQVRRIDERPIRPIKIQTSTSRLESGQIRELSDQKNGGSVSTNSHGGSQSTAKESQGGSLMTYAQPVRLKGMSLPSDGSQGQTESPDSSVFSIDDIESSVIHEIQEPRTIEATGIPQGFINGLALKVLYFGGTMKGWQVAQAMRLHFSGVIEPILQALKAHHLVQVTGGSNLNRASYQYAITEKGAGRARELLERNRYVGPCPVTMDHYTKLVRLQAQYRSLVKEDHVRRTLRGLVLSKEIVDRIGPAVNSYKSIFV
jgi:DNA-binding PadR family transcriptional regulator